MYNSDTELLFPLRVIPSLGSLRSEVWWQLVKQVAGGKAGTNDQLGFVLMMVRLGGCITCSANSFRAMRGCTQCAWQTIRRFRGTDEELVGQFEQSKLEVEQYLSKKRS